MTPEALVLSSLLLGVFVLTGGGYSGLYGAARLTARNTLLYAAYACYVLQAFAMIVICWLTPLAPVWKVFIVLSWCVYAIVPPVTWRYLVKLHRDGEAVQ